MSLWDRLEGIRQQRVREARPQSDHRAEVKNTSSDAGDFCCGMELQFLLGPPDLQWPAISTDSLLHNLQLVRGVGPVYARLLSSVGKNSIADLIEIPRWQDKAALALAAVEQGDLRTLRLLGASDYELLAYFAPQDLAFIDIETIGLWMNQPLFLVGILTLAPDGDRLWIRQFWARNLAEEAEVLRAATSTLSRYPVMVSFNGKRFDLPFIEGRCLENGLVPPTPRLHIDLLYWARRSYRPFLPDCRLQTLERSVWGQVRESDIPGELIPQAYFQFLRTRDYSIIETILEHNQRDLISLVELFNRLGPAEGDESVRRPEPHCPSKQA
ncbi:MAG: ribonuclease H-like domain-containing protein [Clostridia bacterium]|nr:ribonuclease H-like domain-containing protein [Clostridia bacterium]